MQTLTMTRRLGGLMTVTLLLLATVGCNKMLANYSVNKAQDRVEEARENQAEQFAPELLDETNALINKAINEINSQQFKEARLTAKEAAERSKELLEQTKIARTQYLKEQAYFWIEKARLNEGQIEDQQLFNQITENNESGREQAENENWDRAIETFQQVIDSVDFLLSNLEKRAREGLVDARSMKEELVNEGASVHAPEYVERITSQINEIESLIEEEYNYRAALSVRDVARQTKQEGIQETKRAKSFKQIREIENLLDEASQLGAEIYALQTFNEVTKEFANLLTQYYETNYDTVLTAAPVLKPKVEELIVETKREAARAKINAVEEAINNLVDGQARTYLPGSVEQLEALLEESRRLFDEAAYMDSQKISQRALDLEQTIIEDYDQLAQSQINKAQDMLSTAESVYTTMEDIFDRQIDGDWTDTQQTLEQSKQGLKNELQSTLNNAKISLGVASVQREDQNFDTAIEIAKDVAEQAEYVRQQTYRVVAHNAILEISNQLTFYEGQGGRQYAAAELDKTRSLLEETKDLLGEEEYREAVRRAADTKAQLEIMVQELQRVAVNRIDRAQEALETARQNRVRDFQEDAYNQAMVQLDRARGALDTEGLKTAIESAIQAENIATDAATDALRQWSRELIEEADTLLDQAIKAGAERYAPEKIQAALALQKNLQQLYDQGSYTEAVEIGRRTIESANDALYSLVIDAENAIAEARRFGGWDYASSRLAQAIVNVKEAREALANDEFTKAEQKAYFAMGIAETVTVETKRATFEQRLSHLEAQVNKAMKSGAGYYQIEDIRQMVMQINELKSQFHPVGYEDSAERIDRIEAQLANLMEMTPEVLRQVVIKMQDQLAALEAQGASNYMPEKVDEIERKIKFAQLDFQKERYRPSFMNAKDAQQLLNEVAMHLTVRDYDLSVTELMQRFNGLLVEFRPVLQVGYPSMIQMVLGPDGQARAVSMMQAITPPDLRTEIKNLAAEARAMNVPPSREDEHELLMELLSVAITSTANFEKFLILDQYGREEARDIVTAAYMQMRKAKDMQEELQSTLEYTTGRFEPVGVERVMTYQDF